MTAVVEKTYWVWIDTSPSAPTPTWVECEFLSMRGRITHDEVPWLRATVQVRVPASLSPTRYDARQRTRVRIEASTPTPSKLPWCFIERTIPIDETGRVYDLEVVSLEARLLDPANDTTTVWSWRHYLTIGSLVGEAFTRAGLTLYGDVPVPGERCDPVYEKTNYLTNPHGAPGFAEPGTGQIECWLGSGNDGTSSAPQRFTRGVDGHIWFSSHAFSQPSVTPGEDYTYSVAVFVPTGSALIGKSIWVNMRFYLPHPAGSYYYIELGTNTTLVAGWQRVSTTKTAPHGATTVMVGCQILGVAVGAYLDATNAILTDADPGDDPNEIWSGDTATTAQYEFEWAGQQHRSVSVRHPLTPRALESALQEPGESLWSVISPHLARMGWRLVPRADLPNAWEVLQVSGMMPPPTGLDVNSSAGGKHISIEEQTDRTDDEFADAVVLHYRWQRGARFYEAWDRSTIIDPTKVKRVDLDQPYPGFGAAARYRQVAQRRGRTVTVTAPLDLVWRPGDSIHGDLLWCVMDTISFDTDTDLMTIDSHVHL